MEKLDGLAHISVARGCGFAVLGIGTFMFGMAGDGAMAFQAGGILGLAVCAFLLMRAARAPSNPYKRTELWIMLAPADRPPEALAQALVGSALQRSYLRFARHFAFGSALMFAGSIVFKLVRALA